MKMLNLKDKVCVVSGANQGIGRAIAERFLAAGCQVINIDLNIGTWSHDQLTHYQADIGDVEQIATIFEKIKSVDVLVNNAGIQHISSIDEFSTGMFSKLLQVHLQGAFNLAQHCFRLMQQNPQASSSIINIGSIHSFEASANKAAYITAKHGLLGLTRSLAMEGAPYNIKANLVAPGFVRTALVEKQIPDLMQQLQLTEEQVIRQVMLAKTIDKAFTTAAEVAEVVYFFASFPSLALSGQSLLVSHGQNMQ